MSSPPEKILLVDDEPMTLAMLERHLRYLGNEVDTANGASEALEILARRETQIVISDIQMPDISGIQLLTKIREDYPLVRVIMMTGYIGMSNLLACISLGAEGCLTKPLDMDRLSSIIERCRASARDWRTALSELHALSPRATEEFAAPPLPSQTDDVNPDDVNPFVD